MSPRKVQNEQDVPSSDNVRQMKGAKMKIMKTIIVVAACCAILGCDSNAIKNPPITITFRQGVLSKDVMQVNNLSTAEGIEVYVYVANTNHSIRSGNVVVPANGVKEFGALELDWEFKSGDRGFVCPVRYGKKLFFKLENNLFTKWFGYDDIPEVDVAAQVRARQIAEHVAWLKAETEAKAEEKAKVKLDLNGMKRPLIVVDGKRVDNQDEFMKSFDPATIDHIDVIKNEELKEVYSKTYNGDASEGVVVITTKTHAAEHKAKQEKEAAEKKKVAAIAMEAPEAEGAFDVVEEMPQFPGGAPELMKFLSMTVKYPEAAEKAGTQGRVIASFIVEKDGSISGAKVVKNVSEELDAEALRVINAMPNWTPGKQKGQAVRVKYTIPISFRLK